MSRFQGMVATSQVPVLQAVHGEAASYTPKGGAATAITAIIDRQPVEASAFDGASPMYTFVVLVSRTDVPTLTVNADTIAFKKRITDSGNTTFIVKELLGQAGGMWELGVA